MDLTLVLTQHINNVPVDGYYGDKTAWFTRTQIGSALEYDDPQNAITLIHKRHRERLDMFSRRCQFDTPSGQQEGYMYSFKGVLEICRWSKQPKANMVMDALYDMAEEVVRKGYFTNMPKEVLFEQLKVELGYDHFIEDTIFPVLEAQEEFTFAQMWEHYCGFPIKTKDDWAKAAAIFNESAKDRKQRLSSLKYCVSDFYDDPDMYRAITRFNWGVPEHRGHYRKIKGVKWFDDYIYAKLKG